MHTMYLHKNSDFCLSGNFQTTFNTGNLLKFSLYMEISMEISMNLDTCMEIFIAAVCDDLDKL